MQYDAGLFCRSSLSSEILFFFRPGPGDEGPYNFTRIGAGMVNSEVRLSGLEKFTKYSVAVQAFNFKGDGPTSDALIVQTLEDGKHLV